MSDLKRAEGIERLMQLLMHDLRSPLGVAQGYVSLLGGHELSVEDRMRALRGVTDAVARISTLVDDVATLLAPDDAEGDHRLVEAAWLCERVAADAGRRGVHVASRDVSGGMKVKVGTSVDRLSDAIATILSPTDTVRRSSSLPLTLHISRSDADLSFRVSSCGLATDAPGTLEPFDPQTIGSVELLKAHRHISALEGRVWREVGESRACGITLPLSR